MDKKNSDEFDFAGCLHVIGLMVFIMLAAGAIAWVVFYMISHAPTS